jgi:hypothetical protein
MTITEPQTYRRPSASANPAPPPAAGQRGLAALVAAVAIAVGVGYYAHEHSTQLTRGHGTQGGNGGSAVPSWPAGFAAFSPLIGSAPDAKDAWRGATCTLVTPRSDQMTAEVSCSEPNHTTIMIAEYAGTGTVNGLMSDASMQAGDDETWGHGDGRIGGERVSFADPPEILTSFVSHPSMILDLFGGTANVYGLQDDWTAAPLPN